MHAHVAYAGSACSDGSSSPLCRSMCKTCRSRNLGADYAGMLLLLPRRYLGILTDGLSAFNNWLRSSISAAAQQLQKKEGPCRCHALTVPCRVDSYIRAREMRRLGQSLLFLSLGGCWPDQGQSNMRSVACMTLRYRSVAHSPRPTSCGIKPIAFCDLPKTAPLSAPRSNTSDSGTFRKRFGRVTGSCPFPRIAVRSGILEDKS